jgi:hypothetical protein
MACRAGGREAGRLMTRICCVPIFSRMTGIAVLRGSRISAIDVAQVALHTGVRAGQSKRGGAVIERCPRPGSCIVAGRTLLGESCLGVIRIRRPAVIREVTGEAGCRKPGIDIVLMTRCACHPGVGTRKRKGCIAVIKSGSRKGSGGVAKRAVLREPGLGMIRARRAVVIRKVTGDARCRKTGINIILVARRTLHPGMRTGQRERRRAVIEGRA